MSDATFNENPVFKELVCIFKCGDPLDESMLAVEMNVDAEGNFHGNQDHLNHAERISGLAHHRCYAEWYQQTYGTPFTMST